MTLTQAKPELLTNKADRAKAKLALIARADTWFGGCKALTIAERLSNMGSMTDYHIVCSDVYTGGGRQFIPYECPECGQVHLGEESALNCCFFDYDEELEPEPEEE